LRLTDDDTCAKLPGWIGRVVVPRSRKGIMSSLRGLEPLRFLSLGHTDLDRLNTLQLEPVERFLEPLCEIVRAVRRGAAHHLVGIEAGGALAGFYVVHPDRRDRSCWWLGWLAIDLRWQGAGLGRAALAAAMARLARIAGCRRVRLLVAPDNAPALRLYRRAGFTLSGTWPATGEMVMEFRQPAHLAPGRLSSESPVDRVLNAYSLVQAMWLRLWRRGVPPAARMSGEFHGPPAVMVSQG
jgi:GNAT superfamily N-acetyltransferase